MEITASSFKLRANPPEGRKQFPISFVKCKPSLYLSAKWWAVLASVFVSAQVFGIVLPTRDKMTPGIRVVGESKELGVDPISRSKDFTVQEIASTASGNVLWPGEKASFRFRITNVTRVRIVDEGAIKVVHYTTGGMPGAIWEIALSSHAEVDSVPLKVDLAPLASTEITIEPKIPETFGGYAFVAELNGHGRAFAASVVRVLRPDDGAVQFPACSLEIKGDTASVARLFKRIGVKAARIITEAVALDDKDYDKKWSLFAEKMKALQANDVTIMLTFGACQLPQPLGVPRPHLESDGTFKNTKSDMAWLPSADFDFEKWVNKTTSTFGWPKGPINVVEVWDEPWEGLSVSGWGADMIRYREIFTAMARGVEKARSEDGVQVLMAGVGSSSNTLDKLFSDGSDTYLKWLDVCTVPHQPMGPSAALMPEFLNRKSPYGPVRIWDTESFYVNSEDRIGLAIAANHAMGQERTLGVYEANVYEAQNVTIDGQKETIIQAWSGAAAMAASTKFVGQRKFRELLFQNGLPWVFVFDGPPGGSPDNGTVVIAGDIASCYARNALLFRNVYGLKNQENVLAIKEKLACLSPKAPNSQRQTLQNQLENSSILQGGSLTISNGGGEFELTDFCGNPVPAQNGKITVPLDGFGYYVRTNGSTGSFARLLNELRRSRIEGYAPVEIIPHDLTAPLFKNPSLRLTLTNVLNRAVTGKLTVRLGDKDLAIGKSELILKPHETRKISVAVAGVQSVPANTYPVHAVFDAGADGKSIYSESVHCNVIANRTVSIDGKLEDWEGVLPQTLGGAGFGDNLTDKAWMPSQSFDASITPGFSTGYVAYDDQNFYFAVRTADPTPDAGMVRFETRKDDYYFYPEVSKKNSKELIWPDGVRNFSYRMNPDLPAGSRSSRDNAQIAFNVLPADQKPWLQSPAGTPPRWMVYWDTDYEYAFNPVAQEYGGGTEIWRLAVPGMPHKHFYPRQPKSKWDGPVKNGQLVIRHEDNTRVVEAALPWTEIPEVKKRLDANQTIKFAFRVNDNGGPSYELGMDRGASKINHVTFHADWQIHWSNELEFGFEKGK